MSLSYVDAFESGKVVLLRTAREEILAVAGEREHDPVRDAMREMLRQRRV